MTITPTRLWRQPKTLPNLLRRQFIAETTPKSVGEVTEEVPEEAASPPMLTKKTRVIAVLGETIHDACGALIM